MASRMRGSRMEHSSEAHRRIPLKDGGIRIREMTAEDVDIGMKFKELAGWNQTGADWERFLAIAPGGCFVAEVEDEPVGTVVTVIFEDRCGWVAMVLVPPQHRRKGIGTAMLHHGIDYLKSSSVETIKLDATPMGREVYLPLGFVDEYGLERWEGKGQAFEVENVFAMSESDLSDVIALDTPVYGLSRAALVRRLFEDSNGVCGLVRNEDGEVQGYAMARPGSNAWQLGPVLANSRDAGEELIKWSLSRLADQPVFFDVPLVNQDGVAIAKACGFSVQRQFTRMYLGERPFAGQPSFVYATSGPEKG